MTSGAAEVAAEPLRDSAADTGVTGGALPAGDGDATATTAADRLFPAAYRAVLADEFTFVDNPLAARDARRDRRRPDLLVLSSVTLLVLWLACATAGAVVYLQASAGQLEHGIPAPFGGSFGALILVVTSGLHVWAVYIAAWTWTSGFFLREYRQNTLPLLLGTRTLPFQLVLQAAMRPFVRAMSVAALGLPFYAFAWSIGGVSAADVLGVAIVFALIAFRPPRWFVPAFAGLSAEEIARRYRKGHGTAWSEQLFFSSFTLAVFGQMLLGWAFGPMWVLRLVQPLWAMLPTDLRPLALSLPLSWVVALERLLRAPLPFYGLAMPPLVAVLVLYPAGRLLTVWLSSMFLRAPSHERIARLWDWPAFARVRALQHGLFLFFIIGFLWSPYVASNLTGSVVSTHAASPGLALAGVLWLIGARAALGTWARAAHVGAVLRRRRAVRTSDPTADLPPMPPQQTAAYLVTPLLRAFGIYVVGCLLARTAPFPPEAARLAGELFAVTVASAALLLAVEARLCVWGIVWLLPLAGWAVPDTRLAAAGAWFAALSPVTGLLSLTEQTARILGEIPNIHPSVPAWWSCAAVSGGVALIAVASGLVQRPAAVAGTAAQARTSADAREQPVEGVTTVYRRDQPAAQRLIAWVQQHVDNAVLTKELRVGLRGHLGRDELIALIVVPLVLVSFAMRYVDTAMDVLGACAPLFFGSAVHGPGQIFAGMVTLMTGILAVIVPVAAAASCAAGFGRERERSTLGFLLTTPMRSGAIVAGKLAGMLAPYAVFLAAASAWDLAFALAVLPFSEPLPVLVGTLLAIAAPWTLTALGGLLGFAASMIFRRENDASAASALALIVFGAAIPVAVVATGVRLPAVSVQSLPAATLAWLAVVGLLTLAAAPVAIHFVTWRLNAGRRGDIAFEGAGK